MRSEPPPYARSSRSAPASRTCQPQCHYVTARADLDGDGYADVTRASVRVRGSTASDAAGEVTLALPDLDGDTVPEIAVVTQTPMESDGDLIGTLYLLSLGER